MELKKIDDVLSEDAVKQQFVSILKNNANSFTANLAVIVNNSDALSKCDPMSIVRCAVEAASMGLSLSPGLGQAAIVPYYNKGQQVAQFQIMYKGLTQLCIRSGQYATISACEIYEGQLVSENPLTGFVFDFSKKKSEKVIGYAAYFKLLNGFEKTIYSPIDKLTAHGKRFSKTFQKGYGLWVDDFHSMCMKTVTKSLLDKWGPKSIEMQKALAFDQAAINENGEPEYVDAEDLNASKRNELPKPSEPLRISQAQMQRSMESIKTKPIDVLKWMNDRVKTPEQEIEIDEAVNGVIKELSYDPSNFETIGIICELYPVNPDALSAYGLIIEEGKVKQSF